MLGYPKVLVCDSETSGRHRVSQQRLQCKARGVYVCYWPYACVHVGIQLNYGIFLIFVFVYTGLYCIHVCLNVVDKLVCFICATHE